MFNSFYGETLKVYQNWLAGSFRAPAVPDRVRDYLLHLAVESPAGKYQALWPHQREAVLRAIFSNEILKPTDAGWKDLLLNVVTGGGKTTIIAAIMAYLRVCLFQDANTARKLKAGDAFCRRHGMKFRVITKSFVSPEVWMPDQHVRVEAPSPVAPPPQISKPEPSGCLGVMATFVVVVGFFIWISMRIILYAFWSNPNL